MTNGWVLLQQYFYAVLQFVMNPVFYAFALFIFLHYRKQMIMERQLFAVRVQSPVVQTIRSIWMGALAGLVVSLLAAALGIVVQETDLWMVFVLALLLAFVRVRYLCLAYATSILTVLHGIASLVPVLAHERGAAIVWEWLAQAQPLPLLALVALLHLAEALLIRWNNGGDASPMFIEGKRGRIVGAYQLQSFWLTPLLVLVPTGASGGLNGALYQGWPMFSPEATAASLGLALIPAITGFSVLTQSMIPRQKAGEISKQLVVYSLLLLGFSYAAIWVPTLVWLAATFAFFGHEGLVWLSNWREEKSTPFFIQTSQGLKVMAVIPDTPADEMGIEAGEIIVKVNGLPVRNKEQLYPALQVNPAFCKMEVLTHEREIKFVQCAIYAGNHHQLGIIVVPDTTTEHYVNMQKMSLISLLKQRIQKIKLGA